MVLHVLTMCRQLAVLSRTRCELGVVGVGELLQGLREKDFPVFIEYRIS